jgi:hypothetical protein
MNAVPERYASKQTGIALPRIFRVPGMNPIRIESG